MRERVYASAEELQQKLSSLEERAAFYRGVLDLAPDILYELDAEGRLAFVSRAVQQLGYRPEELLGRPFIELVHPEDRGKVENGFVERRVADRSTMNVHVRLLHKQGTSTDFELNVRHVALSTRGVWDVPDDQIQRGDKRLLGVLGIARDITGARRTDAVLAHHARISAAFAALGAALVSSASLEEISQLVLDTAQELTDSPYGYAGHVDPQTGHMVAPALTPAIWEECKVPNGSGGFKEFSGLWGWSLTHKRPVLTNAAEQDERRSGVPEGHVPIQRFLCAPAVVNGELLGQVAVANASQDYTQADLDTMQRLATLYGLAVQRERAQDRLRQLSEAIEQSPSTVVITDADGRIEYVNPRFAELTGYSAQEAIGQTPGIMKSGLTAPEVYEQLWSTIKAGQVWSGELCNRKKNGELYWEKAAIAPIHNAQGAITHFVAIKEDITAQKRAEETLRRLVAATATATGQGFFEALVGEMAQWLGARWAMVSEIDPEDLSQVKPIALWDHGEIQCAEPFSMDGTPCQFVMEKGFYMIEERAAETTPHCALLTDLGVKSYVGCAVHDETGAVIGLLCVFHDHPLSPPPETHDVMALLSHRAGAEMLRLRAEQALHDQMRELETFAQAMVGRESRVIELKEEVNQLCEELGREPAYPPVWNEPAGDEPGREAGGASDG